jgi:hypothetical protein
MSTQRLRTGNRLTGPKDRPAVKKYPARRFPIQSEIQRLEDELNAFNERIAELEYEGHRSHAMDVLKANALDFARQIDELRGVLVESASKR